MAVKTSWTLCMQPACRSQTTPCVKMALYDRFDCRLWRRRHGGRRHLDVLGWWARCQRLQPSRAGSATPCWRTDRRPHTASRCVAEQTPADRDTCTRRPATWSRSASTYGETVPTTLYFSTKVRDVEPRDIGLDRALYFSCKPKLDMDTN